MVAIGYFRWPLIVAAIVTVSAYLGQPLAQAAGDAVSEDAAAVNDEAAIRGVMASYNNALNGGKTIAVMPLYAEDGVFMPPYSPSAVGKDAVHKAYGAVFDELKFHVKFTIAESVVMAPRGRMCAQTQQVRPTIARRGGRPQKRTRSFSSSERIAMESGGSLDIASHRPIHPRSKPRTEPVAT
jgi:ketosteroid isomerase-like protein